MPISGVLLDKDGTILDFARTWAPINREAALFAAAGDPALANELLALGGQDPVTGAMIAGSVLAAGTHDEVAEVFAERLGDRVPPRFAGEIGRIFSDGGGRHAVLLDGARDAIDRLCGAGLVLGLATNDTVAGLEASLGRHAGLLDRFAFRCGCDSGHGIKPAPGMVAAFCHAIGVAAGEVAVVGDSPHDLEMGRRGGVGLRIGVLGGTSGREHLEPLADMVLDGIAAVPDALAPHVKHR